VPFGVAQDRLRQGSAEMIAVLGPASGMPALVRRERKKKGGLRSALVNALCRYLFHKLLQLTVKSGGLLQLIEMPNVFDDAQLRARNIVR
jgi:hypothetical protein